jgi:hypothetical protein
MHEEAVSRDSVIADLLPACRNNDTKGLAIGSI